MSQSLRLLACQINVPSTANATERNDHVEASCQRICKFSTDQKYDLIVLPELASIEYSSEAFDKMDALAEPLDGPSFQQFAGLATNTGAVVVYGFARRSDAGPKICQAAIGPDGCLIGYYDKLHLAQFGASAEAAAFQSGDHLFTFTVKGMKIAPLICYDIRFPQLASRLMDENVDVVLQCSAYARDLSFHSWRHFVVARAMENNLAWLGLNRAGENWGGSVWCPGYADSQEPELVFGNGEEFRTIELAQDFRSNNTARLPFLRDVRKDYTTLPVMNSDKKTDE